MYYCPSLGFMTKFARNCNKFFVFEFFRFLSAPYGGHGSSVGNMPVGMQAPLPVSSPYMTFQRDLAVDK